MNNPTLQEQVIEIVLAERDRQDFKWGSQRHLDDRTWLTILAEEFGEVAKSNLEHDLVGMREEIVQVAAVAVAWLEGLLTRE